MIRQSVLLCRTFVNKHVCRFPNGRTGSLSECIECARMRVLLCCDRSRRVRLLLFLLFFFLRHTRKGPRRPAERDHPRKPCHLGVRDCLPGRPGPEKAGREDEERLQEEQGRADAVRRGKDAEAVDQVQLWFPEKSVADQECPPPPPSVSDLVHGVNRSAGNFWTAVRWDAPARLQTPTGPPPTHDLN